MDEGQQKSKMPGILDSAEIADVVETVESNEEKDANESQQKSEAIPVPQRLDASEVSEDSENAEMELSTLDVAYQRAQDLVRTSPFTKEYCLLGNVSDFGENALIQQGKGTSIMVIYDQVYGVSFSGDSHGVAVLELGTTILAQMKSIFGNNYCCGSTGTDYKVRNSRNCGARFIKRPDCAISIRGLNGNYRILLATEVGVHHEDMNMLLLEGEVLLNYYTTILYVLLVDVVCDRAGVPQSVRYALCKRLPNNRLPTYEQHVKKRKIQCDLEKKLGPRRVSEKELLVMSQDEIAEHYDLIVVADETVTRGNMRDVVFHLDYNFINQHIPLSLEIAEDITITIPEYVSAFILDPPVNQ